jgi:MFS family permease
MENQASSRWLLSICVAYGLVMLVFLNYAAVLPLIQKEWRLSGAAAGSIFSAYQVGYILSAVLLTSLTDRFNTKYIFVGSALWSALANILFALFATDLSSALVLRALAGLGMGGTYMPGLKMVADRFASAERGKAVGLYTSAFVFGAAASVAVAGGVAAVAGWRMAIFTTAIGALIGSTLSWEILRDHRRPCPAPAPRPFTGEVLRNTPALLMMGTYAGHMWEMYGMRAWMAAFLTASFFSMGYELERAAGIGANATAAIVAVGGVATGLAGMLSDRIGRTRTVTLVMSLSAACSFAFGWLFGTSPALVLAVGFLYSFLVVAESPVLSAGLTELVSGRYLGAAMGMQTLFGFLAASLSPPIFGYVLDLTNPQVVARGVAVTTQWGYAFSVLGVGALLGPICMMILRRLPACARMANGRG